MERNRSTWAATVRPGLTRMPSDVRLAEGVAASRRSHAWVEHDEDYHQRRAIEQFERAICKQATGDRRKAIIAYLIGERYRWVNDAENAAAWFERVASLRQ